MKLWETETGPSRQCQCQISLWCDSVALWQGVNAWNIKNIIITVHPKVCSRISLWSADFISKWISFPRSWNSCLIFSNNYDRLEIRFIYPPKSKKLSSVSTCLIFRTLVHMAATDFSVSVDGSSPLSASPSDSFSKGGNAFLSSFPVAWTMGMLENMMRYVWSNQSIFLIHSTMPWILYQT